MFKALRTIGLLLALAVPALATVNCPSGLAQFGPHPPTNVCVKTYPDNSATYNDVLFTWTVNSSSDCKVHIAHDADLGGPSVSREVYSSGLTTSCSVLVSGIVPAKTYGGYVESCTSGPNCSRTSLNISSSPFGSRNGSLFSFPTTGTNSSHAFNWNGYISGPHNIFPGLRTNYGLNGYKTDGPDAFRTILTSVSWGGTPCAPYSKSGGYCGSTGVKFQFICGNNEAPNAGTNNYISMTVSGGSYDGLPICNIPNTDHEANQLGLVLDPTVAAGTYTLSATVIQTDNALVQVGSTRTLTYAVTVLPTPTYTTGTPVTFPAIASIGAWKARIFTLIQNYIGLKTANQTSPGIYSNDNASAFIYDFNPTGLLTYEGADRVPYGISDFLTGVTTAFSGIHSYTYGDWVCTNGAGGCAAGSHYVLVVTNAAGCLSGASQGSIPAVGSSVTSGTCTFSNIGNPEWWRIITERTDDQHLFFELLQGKYTVWQEWAQFPDVKACYRREPLCVGSKHAIGINYGMYPFVSEAGAQSWQRSQYTAVQEPMDTLRSLAYDLNAFTARYLINGVRPVDNGVDEINIRRDMLIQSLMDFIHYSPRDGVNSTYACCLSFQNFDVGFSLESLIRLCAVTQHVTGSCPAVIPVVVKAVLDYLWSNQFNLTGVDYAEPYQPFTSPQNVNVYNYNQTSLNPLTGYAYTWLWAYTGDSCTLPTSGVTCLAAGDIYMAHSFDNIVGGGISGKEGSQWYKGFYDWYNWRSNLRTAQQIDILPAYNTYTAPSNTMEPFVQATWVAPPFCAPTDITATCTVYSFLPPTDVFIKYDTSGVCNPNSDGITVHSTASTLMDVPTGLYVTTIPLTGLSANNPYCFGVGITNANGTGYSQRSIQTNNPWTFITQASQVRLTCATCTGTLMPPATQGLPYDVTFVASGGIAPYTVVLQNCSGNICSGNTVPGLTLAVTSPNAVYSGVPSVGGVGALSFKVCDATSHCGNSLFRLNISSTNSLTITSISPLPSGTKGSPYSFQFMATGGVLPYTWCVMHNGTCDNGSGFLPDPLVISTSGFITGTPTQGSNSLTLFYVQVTDDDGITLAAPMALSITSPTGLSYSTTGYQLHVGKERIQ